MGDTAAAFHLLYILTAQSTISNKYLGTGVATVATV